MNNKKFLLNTIDPEDIGSIVHKVSSSFGLRFEIYELKGIKNFAQLCDIIHDKVKHQHEAESCSAQHAFYKLRNAITCTTGTDRNAITTKTCLKDLLPREEALNIVANVEAELGLRRKKEKQKVLSNLISLVKGKTIGKAPSNVQVKTLGQLAEKISREHHQECKRTSAHITRDEIAEKLRELFPQPFNSSNTFTEPTFG
jgi:Glu-tRNA(Gln) amidotransferase subunit E-like FAD-binding protein